MPRRARTAGPCAHGSVYRAERRRGTTLSGVSLRLALGIALGVALGAPTVAEAQSTPHGYVAGRSGRSRLPGRSFELRNAEGVLALVLLALAGLVGVALLGRSPPTVTHGGVAPRPPRDTRKWTNVDVGVIRLALDVPGAPRGLSSVSPRVTTDLDAGRLRSLALELRHARAHWTHVGGTSHKPMSPAMAEGLFDVASDSAAAALARSAATDDLPASRYRAGLPRSESVVVLVVASRQEVRDFDATSASDVVSTLSALERTSNDALIRAEVIWGEVRPQGLGADGLGLTAIAPPR